MQQLAGPGRVQIVMRPAVALRPPDQILAVVDEPEAGVAKERADSEIEELIRGLPDEDSNLAGRGIDHAGVRGAEVSVADDEVELVRARGEPPSGGRISAKALQLQLATIVLQLSFFLPFGARRRRVGERDG